MNLERLLSSDRLVTDNIETKNWICRRYEVWLGSERINCYVRRKYKRKHRRGFDKDGRYINIDVYKKEIDWRIK